MSPKPARDQRKLVLIACMAATAMSAIEQTIVATAIPAIVTDLGGFTLFGWIFAVYLLTQALTIPLYGRFADLYGRKLMIFIGIGLFLLGSMLCGFATSVPMLIAFRALQGLGAGGVQSISMTIIGDIYSPTERGQIQGYITSVWAVSAISGPMLGALIVTQLNWEFIFWVNLPVGAVAVYMLQRYMPAEPQAVAHKIDLAGTLLLTMASGTAMFTMLQGSQMNWSTSIGLLAVAALSVVLLTIQERRAPEPLLPLILWRNRTILMANLAMLGIGVVVMCVTAFVPTYVQGVMGQSSLVSGITLATMSIGWPLASTFTGRAIAIVPDRTLSVIGGTLLTIGSFMLLWLAPGPNHYWAMAATFVIGAGMGTCTSTFIISIQTAAGREARGIATASMIFMRILGSSLGTAVLGGVLNFGLVHRLSDTAGVVESLMDPHQRAALSVGEVSRLSGAVADALHQVFWVSALIAVASLAMACLLPAGRRLAASTDAAGGKPGQ